MLFLLLSDLFSGHLELLFQVVEVLNLFIFGLDLGVRRIQVICLVGLSHRGCHVLRRRYRFSLDLLGRRLGGASLRVGVGFRNSYYFLVGGVAGTGRW